MKARPNSAMNRKVECLDNTQCGFIMRFSTVNQHIVTTEEKVENELRWLSSKPKPFVLLSCTARDGADFSITPRRSALGYDCIGMMFGDECVVRDGFPVLFKQERVGLDGRRFRILKFRTMVPVEKQKPTVYADDTWKNGVPDDFVSKSGHNPYVTPTGKFLRKYSLDELPQFFNVLGGSMSLVGPRPEIPAIADYYNEH